MSLCSLVDHQFAHELIPQRDSRTLGCGDSQGQLTSKRIDVRTIRGNCGAFVFPRVLGNIGLGKFASVHALRLTLSSTLCSALLARGLAENKADICWHVYTFK
jgi:hypothetical protein